MKSFGSRRRTAVAIAVASVLALAGCSAGGTAGPSEPAATGGTLTLAANADNNSFDRALLEIGHRVQFWMPVFDTLLVLSPDGELEPNLATEWEYNDDATVLSLTLRDDVEFSDGSPFDGEAVKANLEYLKAGTGQNAYMAASIDEIVVNSPTDVELRLSQPDPGLVWYLAVVGGAIASPASLSASDAATNPVGSGPYIYDADASTQGTKYVYEKNADYWNSEAFPYDEIVINPISDQTARLNALKAGQADFAVLDPRVMAEAEGSGLNVGAAHVDWQGLFLADRAGATIPALADLKVRQAINMVIDRQSLLDSLWLGQGTTTSQIYNVDSQAYVEELDGAYEYDVDAAQALMAEAGYSDGFAVTMPELSGAEQFSPFIEDMLGELNITVTWEKIAPDQTIPELLSGKYPIFFFTLGSQSAWQDFRKVAFPTSPWNTAKVDDPAMDALLAEVTATQGDEQDAAMQEVNRYMVENAWFAPFFRGDTVLVSSARVEATPQTWNVMPWTRNFQPSSQ